MTDTEKNANSSTPIFNFEELATRLEQTLKTALKQPIHPDAVYDYEEVSALTGFSVSTIIRADRKRRLVGRYEGRRRYFLGRDVLAWLSAKEATAT